jgi:hypothetical protein
MSFLKTLWRKIFPPHIYHQVHVVNSDPYGEDIYPFQFLIAEVSDPKELDNLAKNVYRKLHGSPPSSYWSCQEVRYMGTTYKSLKGIKPFEQHGYEMGSYTCKRRAYHTVNVKISNSDEEEKK